MTEAEAHANDDKLVSDDEGNFRELFDALQDEVLGDSILTQKEPNISLTLTQVSSIFRMEVPNADLMKRHPGLF